MAALPAPKGAEALKFASTSASGTEDTAADVMLYRAGYVTMYR